jgi:predicted DNA-binding transcriptional regulator AlpA
MKTLTKGQQMDLNNIGGTSEVAELLGCPKQQIHALRKRANFPKPIKILDATPLWNLDDIRDFATTWIRRTPTSK